MPTSITKYFAYELVLSSNHVNTETLSEVTKIPKKSLLDNSSSYYYFKLLRLYSHFFTTTFDYFMLELKNDVYQIGGIPISVLTEKYDTPIYVYDTAIMARQYDQLKTAFNGANTKIKFACKALNNINILKFFKNI